MSWHVLNHTMKRGMSDMYMLGKHEKEHVEDYGLKEKTGTDPFTEHDQDVSLSLLNKCAQTDNRQDVVSLENVLFLTGSGDLVHISRKHRR